jgi:hypothetical protein
MKGDFTRSTFDPRKHYTRVLKQQGRVDLDADWNEAEDIDAWLDRTRTVDVIGQSGAPIHSNGFRIEIGADGGLTISPGRFYVDGVLCTMEGDAPVPITEQPDLPGYLADEELADGTYAVYLDAWDRHVTYVEDPEIREVALGGPDTTTRTRTVAQVRVRRLDGQGPIGDVPCPDPPDRPTGTLEARPDPADDPSNPCVVPAAGGYRGLENRLYRVEVHDDGSGGGPVTFKWSRDNGSVVLPIAEGGIDGDVVAVRRLGFDDVLTVRPGDWVEVLGDETELHGRTGTLTQVATDGVDEADLEVTLNADVSAHADEGHLKVRRWDSDGALAITGDWIELEDGVQVRFDPDATYHTGDYWTIPARTREGTVLWPREGEPPADVPAALPPQGIVHHVATLGVATFSGEGWTAVRDCRPTFPPLTEVDGGGCCCVEVRPGEDVQQAIDTVVAAGGGRVALCAGEHRVRGSLRVRGANDLLVVGEGDATVVRFLETSEAGLGGFVIEASQRVAVERLLATSDSVPALVSVTHGPEFARSRGIALRHLTLLNLRASDGETDFSCGVRLGHADGVRIEACRIAAEVGVLSLWGDRLPDLTVDPDGGGGVETHVTFDGLEAGSEFSTGERFTDPGTGVEATVEPFFVVESTPLQGIARTTEELRAGGSGNEVELRSANLGFAFGEAFGRVRFRFANQGNRFNLRVNGELRLFNFFQELDGTQVGGADVSVSIDPATNVVRGEVMLDGPVTSFSVGGSSLRIDDVRLSAAAPVPEFDRRYGGGVARLAMRHTGVRFEDYGVFALRAERWSVDDCDFQPYDDEPWQALRRRYPNGGTTDNPNRPPHRYASVLAALEGLFATPAQQPRGTALASVLWRDSVLRTSTLGGAAGADVWWWVRGGARENTVAAGTGLAAFWLHNTDWDGNTVEARDTAFAFAGVSGARLTHNRVRGPNGLVNAPSGGAFAGLGQTARVAARAYGVGQEQLGPTVAAWIIVEDAVDLLGIRNTVSALEEAFAETLQGLPFAAFLGAWLLSQRGTTTTALPVIGLDVAHNDFACTERCVALEGFLPLGALRIVHNRLHTTTGQALRLDASPFFANGHLLVLFFRFGMASLRRSVQRLREQWADGDQTQPFVPVLTALDRLLAQWEEGMEGFFDLDFRVESNTVRSLRTAIDANLYELAVVGNHVTLQERRDPRLPETQTGVLTGAVRSIQGGGLPGAQVQVVGTPLATVTDADGRYRLPGVPVGTHTVRASFTGLLSATQEVTIHAGETTTADFDPRPLLAVRGRVAGGGISAGVAAGVASRAILPLSRATASAPSTETAAVLDALEESEALEPLALVLRDGAHVDARVYADFLLSDVLTAAPARRDAADAVAVVGSVTTDAGLAATAASLGPSLRANNAAEMRQHLPAFLDGVRGYVDGLGVLVRGLGGRIVGNHVLVPADARPETRALGGVQVSISQREVAIAAALGSALLRAIGGVDQDEVLPADPLLGTTETLVQDNEVAGGLGHGISVQGLPGQPDFVEGLRIRGNAVSGTAGVGIYGNEHALLLDLAVEDNGVERCGTADGFSRAKGGIVFHNAALCTVRGNRVAGCGAERVSGQATSAFGIDLDTVYGLAVLANEVRANGAGPRDDANVGSGGGLRIRAAYGGGRVHDNAVAFNRGYGLLWAHPFRESGIPVFPDFIVDALNRHLGLARKESDLRQEEQASVQGNVFTGEGPFPLLLLSALTDVAFSGNTCRAPLAPLGEVSNAARAVVANNLLESGRDITLRLSSVSSGAVVGNVGDGAIQLQNATIQHGFNVPNVI